MVEKLGIVWDNLKWIAHAGKQLGFFGMLKELWKDLVSGRTWKQWFYLLALCLPTLVLKFMDGTRDTLGFLAAFTGIFCVILVTEGRISNYFIGLVHELIYLYVSFENMYYGEVITTIFFISMQFVGAYYWLVNRRHGQKANTEVKDVKAKKLTLLGWGKSILATVAVWLFFGFVYQSIGSARPFWDSSTDGTNWTGQFLQTGMYREQWIFWIATNILSIFLWWGAEPQVMIMYLIYMFNSIIGWFKWEKDLEAAN